MTKPYTLYAAPLSLYSGKARAYLNYKNIPYEEVLSSLRVYKKVIIPHTGVKYIPVVKTPDAQYLQDTTDIIDALEQRFPDKPVYPQTPLQCFAALVLELYADEWLLIPAMHYRWNFDNFPFIYQQFGSTVFPSLPRFMQTFIGKKAGARFKGFVPMLGISETNRHEIEDWYESFVLPTLDKHFADKKFVFGNAPSLADFGLIGPLYAHLYRDPYPGQLMKRKAPHVARWVERMLDTGHIEDPLDKDDHVAPTLLPLLRDAFARQWPVLRESVKALETWRKENPEAARVPRSVGKMRYRFSEIEEERAIITYSQWMLQRVIDYYEGLQPESQQKIDALLSELGAENALDLQINTRIERKNNVMVFCD